MKWVSSYYTLVSFCWHSFGHLWSLQSWTCIGLGGLGYFFWHAFKYSIKYFVEGLWERILKPSSLYKLRFGICCWYCCISRVAMTLLLLWADVFLSQLNASSHLWYSFKGEVVCFSLASLLFPLYLLIAVSYHVLWLYAWLMRRITSLSLSVL